MYKKLLMLIFSCLFITGCTVNYNLEINNNKILEEVKISSNSKVNTDRLSSIKQYNYNVSNDMTYYKFDYNKDDNTTNVMYTYDYSIDDFKNSRVLKECYSAFNVLTSDETITITTSNKFNCFVYEDNPIEKVNINIKTNHEVIESNAHKINDDTYTWNLKNNKDNTIKFVISKEPKDTFWEDTADSFMTILTILGVVCVIGVIVFIRIKYKSNKVNKI